MTFRVISLFDEREANHEEETLPAVMLATMQACGLMGFKALGAPPEVYSEAFVLNGEAFEATVCGYREIGGEKLVPCFAVFPMPVEQWVEAAPSPPAYSEEYEE